MYILKYLLLWGDILIGRIYVEKDRFRFEPVLEGIKCARKQGLIHGLLLPKESGEVPPFLLNRLKNDPECVNHCRVNTDKLEIVKVAS